MTGADPVPTVTELAPVEPSPYSLPPVTEQTTAPDLSAVPGVYATSAYPTQDYAYELPAETAVQHDPAQVTELSLIHI